ncbi:MAG: thioredoxin domain-containing protein, partial [Candidatus Nanohaloarchaea archaeon]|nr:thioredoxin domain-containing protein [Candidatus Nanohaloarchaea archaeon]
MPEDLDAERFEEVKDSGETWFVDFWAEWCVAPETVVYANDALVEAEALGDSSHNVFSYNPVTESLQRSEVNSVSASHQENLLKLTTETGRQLTITPEHQVFGEEAGDVEEGERVAVCPVQDSVPEFPSGSEVLVDVGDIEEEATDSMRTTEYVEELKRYDLLPLTMNQEELVPLTRLLGLLFSDGSMSEHASNNQRFVEFIVGREEDVKEVCRDLEALGFEPRVQERDTTVTFDEREVDMHTWRVRISRTSLFLLLKAVGAPAGKKTDTSFTVPDWVMNGADGIKREFLRGYLGGEGPKPAIHRTKREQKGDYNSFVINDLEFHKREDLEGNGLEFGHQVADLLEEFGVTVRSVDIKETFDRSDGTSSVKIAIRLADTLPSFHSYTRIGVAYSRTKWLEFLRTREYTRKRLYKHDELQRMKEKAVELREEGGEYEEIADALGLNEGTVYGWLHYDQEPLPANESLYDEWLSERSCDLGGEFLWEKVDGVEEVGEGETVSLEVDGTYNFIGNGILTHNCGPCKQTEPIVEELSEEIDDVEFGKVDVDEHQELATSQGVRSIPTFVILKEGEEVSRKM